MSTAITKSTRSESSEQLETAVQEKSISRSEIFEVLSNDRRQYVIRYLLEKRDKNSAPLGKVVDYVAERENDVSNGELDTAQRKRVYTALRQCHLPKMDDYEVVNYDNSRSEVEVGSALEDLKQYLDYDPETVAPWGKWYLGLSVIAAVVALFSLVGVHPFGGIPTETLLIAIIATFAVSAGVHTYQPTHINPRVNDAWHWGTGKSRLPE